MATYFKSEYDKEIEVSLATISADITTINTAVSTFSGNITSISGNITALNDFIAVTLSTAVFTLDLTTYRNFTITNSTTAAATLKIVNVPTAADTMLNIAVKLIFSATATITYTGTITWSTATVPNPTAVGTFILSMKSFDAGTNWLSSYTGLY